jgi:hypothetical protein
MLMEDMQKNATKTFQHQPLEIRKSSMEGQAKEQRYSIK